MGKLEPTEVREHTANNIEDAPPSYEEVGINNGVISPSPSTSRPSTSTMRSNFVQIITPTRGISGKWTIDLGLPMPPNMGPSRLSPSTFAASSGSRPNVYLSSELNQVHAKITVVDSNPDPTRPFKKAFIVAEAGVHNLSVEITSKATNTKVHICASTDAGNIVIRLPRDFIGPIKCRTDATTNRRPDGGMAVRFTPLVKQKLSAFSMEDHEIYAFVGDPSHDSPSLTTGSSPLSHHEHGTLEAATLDAQVVATSSTPITIQPVQTNVQWHGDQVEVISNRGRIKICYALQDGEEKESEGELQTLMRHLQEAGPIVALAKFAFRGVNKAIKHVKKSDDQEKS
ncbi:hypothetical protein CPB86DRAFT_794596 [Serendipita vermifera]|nr:hypothetical protein CPB86DRAFT_794596 [Serendipita vermifera]